MADKILHDGHRQRLKGRFLKEGIDNFEDHNILELLLFFGIPRKDTNALAHSLMQEFGSLSGVFEAPFEELCKIKGITQNAAFLISMVPQLSRKYLDDKYKTGQVLNSTEKVGKFLLHKYVGRKDEMVSMICMDNKCRVLNWSIVSEGSINAAEVSIRKIGTCQLFSQPNTTGASGTIKAIITTKDRITKSRLGRIVFFMVT